MPIGSRGILANCLRRATSRWVLLATVVGGGATSAAARAYEQSPSLDARVQSGELPPVAQRLPERPVVVRPVHRVGKYGGTWRMMYAGSVADIMLNTRLGYETLLRWDRDAMTVIPGVAESVEVRDGGREFVFKLRKQMRWSDGAPFTSEDFRFFHEHVQKNKAVRLSVSQNWKVDGELYELSAPDPLTVVFRFRKPFGLFPQVVAYAGRQNELFMPAHYVKRFHPEFVDAAELERKTRAAGYADFTSYFGYLTDVNRNPDYPSLGPFVIQTPYPQQRVVAVRNPYYWKVDPAGNQLPYIESVRWDRVLDLAMLNLRALDGQVDFQNRGIDAGNFTLLKEAGSARGYRVQADYATSTTGVYVNQHSRSDSHRPVLADRRFRAALAAAINRPELVELIYNGLARIDNGVSMPGDPYFMPGIDTTHTAYDPATANRLLDELGMKRGAGGGLRHWPDGSAFHEILHVFPAENGTNADLWQLVAEYFREVGLQFSVLLEDGPLSRLQVTNGDSDFFAYRNLSQHWALDGSFKAPTADYSYHAPLYGRYVASAGKRGEKPSEVQQRLADWYEQMRSTADESLRATLARKILGQWSEDPYFIGLCRPIELTVIARRFHNVPAQMTHNFRVMSPGYIGVEQFYIDETEMEDVSTLPTNPVPYLAAEGK